jgi:hypothetical protein
LKRNELSEKKLIVFGTGGTLDENIGWNSRHYDYEQGMRAKAASI